MGPNKHPATSRFPHDTGLCASSPANKNIANYSLAARFLSAVFSGGDERNRTADPLLAKQVLSQLSYTPMCALKPPHKYIVNNPRFLYTLERR